jgi:hypothetical protein
MDWHKYFIYDAETGDLIWRKRPRSMFSSGRIWNSWNAKLGGKKAGTARPKQKYAEHYRTVRVGNRTMKQHRIVWEMCFGPIQHGMLIDHIDGNAFNNRIANLRLATQEQNCRNSRVRSDSSTRLKGVILMKGSFQARIRHDGNIMHLGTFPTKGLAAVARAKAALRYHGKFARFT